MTNRSHHDFQLEAALPFIEQLDDDAQSSLNSSTPRHTNSSVHLDLHRMGHKEHDSDRFGSLETLVTRRSDPFFKANWRVSTLLKFLVVPAGLVPLLVSALLLWAHQKHWYITGPPLIYTSAHRGAIQVVVQILSHILGALQIYVICNLIAFSVRINLVRKSMSLKYLKLFSALVSHQFDFSLPKFLFFQLALFNLFNFAPSALWAGSITPITATFNLTGTMAIAHFGQDSARSWAAAPLDSKNCSTKINTLGTFSNCPGMNTPNRLLASISTASTPTGAIRNSTKNDNTQFAYIGRSYGMGSSVGLVPLTSSPLVENYTYTEYGYNSSVTCIYNSSSTWSRRLQRPGAAKNGIPGIFYAIGYLPNSNLSIAPPFYSIVGWGDQDIFAYQSECIMGRFLYAFTAGQRYSPLERMQCEVSFTPCKYDVVVSPPGKNITVTPAAQCGGADVFDVDPTGRLKCKLVGEISWLPRVATSLYSSMVGDAFMSNINNTGLQGVDGVVLDSNETALLAVGVSLTAAIDDAFAALSSSQVITYPTTNVPVSMTIRVLHFGDAWAIYSVLTLSAFILLITVEEAVRTRFWAELPLFDFVDVKSCILGAALGSGTIVKSTVANLGSDVWLGDGAEPRLDEIKVRLKMGGTGMSLASEANRNSGVKF